MTGVDLGKLVEAAETACTETVKQKERKINVDALTYLDLRERPHRDDGPAVIRLKGPNEWWIHGERHRLDGPAIDGESPRFFIGGGELSAEEFAAVRKALDEGAPMDWVIAYAKGGSEQRGRGAS